MALIKDIQNLATQDKGLKIPDIFGGALSSDIPGFDVSASSFFAPPAFILSRSLVLIGYTLISTSKLEEVI